MWRVRRWFCLRGQSARRIEERIDKPRFRAAPAAAMLNPSHDAERTGAAMNFLDDLRAEWIAIRKSLGDHIAYLEAGNKIHPIDRDPNEATTEFLARLKQYRSEVEGWLVHLPSQGE